MKNLRLIAFAALAFSAAGCESVVEDLNVNPNEFTAVPASLVLQHVTLNTAAVAEAEPARIAGMWSDQFAGTDRQYITQDRYEVDAATFDEVWADLFQDGIAQAKIAQSLALEEGATQLANYAKMLEGYYAAEAALIFGDVPFTQVNDLEIADPAYDSQRDVINAAVSLIREAASGPGSGSAVSVGNQTFTSASSWGQFGNALTARYLLATRDYSGALTSARAAAFDDPSNSVDIIHSTTNFAENLFFQFEGEQRTDYLSFGTAGSEQSTLLSILADTTSMSRADAKTNDAARLAYFMSGVSNGLYKLNVTPTGFFAADQDFPVIGYPEVQLIIAECAARAGGAANLQSAVDALNNARNFWDGVLGTDNYTDYVVADFANDDALIDAILIEKYVSVFGLPTFYDFVRTNNRIGADTDVRTTPAQRFLYPSTEISSNSSFPGLKTLNDPTPINM